MNKRTLAVTLLREKGISTNHEDIVFHADVPYEDTIRKLLRGIRLNDALGKEEIADSVTPCPKCKSLKVTEKSMQTRSCDELATSFYFCTSCYNRWKV